METLVRRLGRIFSLKNNNDKPVVRQTHRPADSRRSSDKRGDHRLSGSAGLPAEGTVRRRMDRLEAALAKWLENKGWREPVRTLGEAADRLDTDTRTLYYYFETRIGQDFRTWRTQLRLEDAKRMLVENPGLPPAEIGRRAGFSNRSNFARQFQAATGLTPTQWRDSRSSRE
jgi:transcriptional regulator GlxA family with amidase domain